MNHYPGVAALWCATGYNESMEAIRAGVLLAVGTRGTGVSPVDLVELAPELEAAGADALFVEAAAPLGEGGAEPFTALGALAATTSLVLGAVVPLAEGRSPAIVAKLATGLELLAPGRVVVVFRVGGSVDPSLREAIEVMKAMRGSGPLQYSGERVVLTGAYNEPRGSEVGSPRVGAIVSRRMDADELEWLGNESDLVLLGFRSRHGLDDADIRAQILSLEGEGEGRTNPGFVLAVHGARTPAVLEAVRRRSDRVVYGSGTSASKDS